jgi:hypothetical protein
LFGAIALRENFYFATKHNDQAKIALTGFEKNIPAFHRASLRNRFQQRQLMILELRESDAFRVAIKTVRLAPRQSHANLTRSAAQSKSRPPLFRVTTLTYSFSNRELAPSAVFAKTPDF